MNLNNLSPFQKDLPGLGFPGTSTLISFIDNPYRFQLEKDMFKNASHNGFSSSVSSPSPGSSSLFQQSFGSFPDLNGMLNPGNITYASYPNPNMLGPIPTIGFGFQYVPGLPNVFIGSLQNLTWLPQIGLGSGTPMTSTEPLPARKMHQSGLHLYQFEMVELKKSTGIKAVPWNRLSAEEKKQYNEKWSHDNSEFHQLISEGKATRAPTLKEGIAIRKAEREAKRGVEEEAKRVGKKSRK